MNISRMASGILCVLMAMAVPTRAAEPALKMGDPAPKLQIAKWMKGDPVKEFEKGKIYIVEFWATWCPPCRASIPHMTETQKKYADKGVICIGCDLGEKPDVIAPFVEKMGEKMDYRVAADDMSAEAHGATAAAWMDAAGQNGIPCAFVVNREGIVAWIGHPMAMDKSLEEIVAGTYDIKKAAAAAAAMEEIQQKLAGPFQKQEWDTVVQGAEELLKAHPEQAALLSSIKFQALMAKKDYDAAYKFGDSLMAVLNDDASGLNEIAWMIAAAPGLEKRDLALAQKMADRAVELSKGESANILDTQARVYSEKGELDKAIATQQKAVEKASDEMKAQLQKTLEGYQAKKAAGGK